MKQWLYLGSFLAVSLALLMRPAATQAQIWYGYYNPAGFTNKQTFQGLSADLEVAVIDQQDKYEPKNDQSVFVINHKFRFQAHQDLPGANCVMLNETSTNLGRVKARCSASVPGRFVFHIESLSASDIPTSGEFEITFSTDKPSATPSPAPKYTVEETPSAAPGPCSSGFAEASFGAYCNGGSGVDNYFAKCRNGYSFIIRLNECRGTAPDVDTSREATIVCGDPRCGPASPTPKPTAKPVKIATTAAKMATSAAEPVPAPTSPVTMTQPISTPAVPEKGFSSTTNQAFYFSQDPLQESLAIMAVRALSSLVLGVDFWQLTHLAAG